MVSRKPNLLDAFQASAPEGKKAPVHAESASVAGPFASEKSSASSFHAPSESRGFGARILSDRLVQFALVVCLVAVVIAYWLGTQRSTQGETQAAGPNASEEAAGGALVRENANAPEPGADLVEANRKAAALSSNVNDAAFLDPRFRFTVRAAQYQNDEAGKKAAFASRDYLRGEGYPVVGPIEKGRSLIVCVGFKEKLEELDPILRQVRLLAGPKGSKKPPYADAYSDNINHLVARK